MTTLNNLAPAAATTAYQAAHQNAIMVDRSDLGVLLIRGETRLDLLHRMSTQKLDVLPSGHGAATVLTSDIGRIIDRLLILATNSALYVLTGENNADNIARYLLRFVFFNDDFKLDDISAGNAVLGVYGPEAAARLSEAGFPEVEMPMHHWRRTEWDGEAVYLQRTDPIQGAGYFVICQSEAAGMVAERLAGAGIILADQASFEYLRIEAGRPRFSHEIAQEYIPLEVDLWDDVSFNKGCYIGQEIIARMESRGRLAKKLFRLAASAPVAVGAAITAGGKNAGVITSAADGPAGPLALGLVKAAYWDSEEPLLADGVELTPATD